MKAILCLTVLLAASFVNVNAQNKGKAKAAEEAFKPQGAVVEAYKTVGEAKLNAYIFSPPEHKASDKRPAIVFFFGGGWQSGSPKQFEQQCRYLASRGMVAITADYRVSSRFDVKAKDCVMDAKDAVRWTRENAKRLGIDPERIAAGGGSAGGHIAACTGVVPGFESKDAKVSSVPNAMVLFNPALVLAPYEGGEPLPGEKQSELKARMGVEPRELSPLHQVKKGAPRTIIFHGKADTTVPYSTAEAFAKAMKAAGNECELKGYEGQPHGFFNFGRTKDDHFRQTLTETDKFLVKLGWLKGEPKVESFRFAKN
jgi:acetyl esterase/lipase